MKKAINSQPECFIKNFLILILCLSSIYLFANQSIYLTYLYRRFLIMKKAGNSQPECFPENFLVLIFNIGEVVKHPTSTGPKINIV